MSSRLWSRRRPSTPLVVSFLALFVALGGVGWAAARLPANSVGLAQLKPGSVGSRKIIPGSVGARQVNPNQVQLRVAGPCTAGAIQSIALSGDVTCTPALPTEYGTNAQAMLGAGRTQVTSESLTAGNAGASYIVIGDVRVNALENGSGPGSADLSCTLSAGAASTAGDLVAEFSGGRTDVPGTIPLVLPVTVTGSSTTVAIGCQDLDTTGIPAPTVTLSATINAIQTAANN
jgi:hypothetical protein